MSSIPSTPRVTEAADRLRAVFAEIPGTRLTASDAARLAGVDRELCEHILLALEDASFLKRGRGGLYQWRRTDSP